MATAVMARARNGGGNGNGHPPPDPTPPDLSAAITSPSDGQTVQGWVGMPLIVKGTAKFDSIIQNASVLVSLNGGPSGNATLGGRTKTGNQVSYTWTYTGTVTASGQTVIDAHASGSYVSKGINYTIDSDDAVVSINVALDTTPPQLQIASPASDSEIPIDPNNPNAPVNVTVAGTAADPETGVKSVLVSGDVVAAVRVTPPSPPPPPPWAWSAAISLPPATDPNDNGKRVIQVRCWDNAGNSTSPTVTVYLGKPYQFQDPNDSLSLLAYLRDLIYFTTQRITRGANLPIKPEDPRLNFYQPFDQLTPDEDAEVHQVRICIEVLRNYLAALQSTVQSKLVGYWKFDEGSGATTADGSGNNLAGTLQGATWTPGQLGSALLFNGSNAYVQVGNLQQLKMTTALSITAWIYPTGPGISNQGGTIVNKEGEYEVARFPDGSIQWAIANTSPGWKWTNTGYIAPPNQWTHIVVTYDGTSVNTYANGQLVHTSAGSGPIGSADLNNHDFRIGGRQAAAQFFQGIIDEVEVFSRGLNADEVLSVFAQASLAHAQLTLDTAQRGYLQAAYITLLKHIGTSYEELRLARSADDPSRKALAARLGIDLEAARPDKLDKLVLQPSNITEQKLEQIFGLVDTTRNPLSPSSQDPDLLTWQRNHLQASWIQEDHSGVSGSDFVAPVVEPDLLVEADFAAAPSAGSNPAYDLWKTRTKWVNDLLKSLSTDRLSGEADQHRLDRLIEANLKPIKVADLLGFEAAYKLGNDITSQLSLIPLSFQAFSYLVRLHNLAGIQPLLDDEWAAAYFILAQTQKERQFSTWRTEEGAKVPPIILSPDYFRLNSDDVQLPQWRASSRVRRKWQDTLAGRINQLDALKQGLHAAVNATEEATLPLLRDALVDALRLPTTVPVPYATGLDSADSVLSDGVSDPHWVITSTPSGPSGAVAANAYATDNKAPVGNPWIANSDTSRWISPQPDESIGDPPGNYKYRTVFDLTGFQSDSVQVAVRVAVDNDLTDIRLNGKSLGLKASGFSASNFLTINSGFVDGKNSLELVVNNAGTTPNPSGLRVEFFSQGIRTRPAQADWLTQRLQIDVRHSGGATTTRINQAVETLQGILFSVRTQGFGILGTLGDISLWKPKSQSDFDADWQWMGSYQTWPMRVFLYPENVLLPSLWGSPSYNKATSTFQKWVSELRKNQPLTQGLASLVGDVFNSYTSDAALPQDADLKTGMSDVQGLINGSLSGQELVHLRDIEQTLYDKYSKDLLHPQFLSYWKEIFYFVPLHLALQLQQSGRFEDALNCFRAVYAYDLPVQQRKIYYDLKREESIPTQYERPDNWLRKLDPFEIAKTRASANSRFTLMSLARCFLVFADSEFTRDTAESLTLALDLYLNALELLSLPEMEPAQNTGFQPNPLTGALRTHAEVSLSKLRNDRNIAGALRPSPMIFTGRGVSVNGNGQLSVPASSAPQPTSYRYSAVIDRAKQLVQLAQQVESPYFAALQQKDAESYNLLKANQDLELAAANIDLQALKLSEANDGVTLANNQKARAQTQFDTYNDWINKGPLDAENDMIKQYQAANDARNWVAGLSAAISTAQAFDTASSGGFLGSGASAGYASAAVVAGLSIGQAAAQIAANNAESQAQIDSANASFERRKEEWQLQRNLAQNDLTIGQDQIQLANDRTKIATQEQTIAGIQNLHDQAIINFLNQKFTNVELYEWMSGVLGGVYRYFLQQATAMARLAESQLSFERQQTSMGVVKADYWQPPDSTGTQTGSTGGTQSGPTDRRGLTGSARLLQDIYQLDQYAFQTNQRKLQLSKTVSLARLAPFEFQQFRGTGVLPFATPIAIFDQDFPGHYLRLVKRVRTSVVALVPPNQGIKATLANTGTSRVTVGGDVFQIISIQRAPELVALTSPMNATGLFELDTQPELLFPFESTGVDALWELRMPKAANRFDYDTIADIMLTIEYTALDSSDYRQQVLKQLNQTVSLERAFSFRQEFADQWYDLNNPDQSATPLTVQFNTRHADFPPNIDDLQVRNVLLYIVRPGYQASELSNVSLTVLTEDMPPKAMPAGGKANTIDGTISIRRGNANSWNSMIGKSPAGVWTLALPDTKDTPDTPGTRTLFKSGAIKDILLVITYAGTTPAWPT